MENSLSIAGSTESDKQTPFSDDEEEISINVEGRNVVHEHNVSGWGAVWKGPNVKLYPEESSKFITTVSRETMAEMVRKLNHPRFSTEKRYAYKWCQERCILIDERTNEPALRLRHILDGIAIDTPITVHVLEKRSVTVTKAGAVFTKFIVADMSGCSTLMLFGDTSIYPVVDVGDILLIGSCRITFPDQAKSELTTIQPQYLCKIQLRLNLFDFRSAYAIKGMNTARWCKEIYPEDGIRVVHELWNCESGDFGSKTDTKILNDTCIDIAGVVVFVGPMMRTLISQADSRFVCFRYIQLVSHVDQVKPLTVKLFCDNLNWSRQQHIVPGIMMVLTNACLSDTSKNCFEPFYRTTYYTRVLVNNEVCTSYLEIRPRAYRLKLRHIASVISTQKILACPKIAWTVGGFPPWVIKNKPLALKYAKSKKRESYLEMQRRQTNRIFVHGYLSVVWIVSTEDNIPVEQHLYWKNPISPNFSWYTETSGFKGQRLDTFHPNVRKHAIGYTRSLPQPQQVLRENEKIFVAYQKNVALFGDICRQLLMPSLKPTSDQKKLSDYPLLRPKYFLLEIIDPFRKQVITAMYNNNTFEKMETNLAGLIMNQEIENDKMMSKFGHKNEARMTKQDKEIRRANAIFAIEVLQQESLGPQGMQNFAVSLMDFTSMSTDT